MNILFLDQFSTLGGAQLCLLDLLPAIRDEGWKAVVAAPGDGALFARASALSAVTARLDVGPYHAGRKSVGDVLRFVGDVPRAVSRIRALIRQHDIDLVYVNGPRLVPAAALAVGREVPMIFHCHSYLRQRYLQWMVRAGLRHRRVIACCEFVGSQFAAYRPTVVFNGVADHRGPVVGGRIGIIGRISPEKGQAEFLRAARLLPGHGFLICGEASDTDYERLVHEVAEGLPVEFTGFQDDVGAVLRSLDLLVVPSSPFEATTRVIPEAFSAGVCVVARRGGGIAEVVRDGENGFLIDSLDAKTLSQACLRALSSDRAAIVQRARATFEEKFTLTRFRRGVVDVIRNQFSGTTHHLFHGDLL